MQHLERWQKALIVAGATAGAAGLLWYLLREGDDEEEKEAPPRGSAGGAPSFKEITERGHSVWKVNDEKQWDIGVRSGPDTASDRTGLQLRYGEVFAVAQVVEANHPPGQQYLQLADGRGWGFTHSPKDGRCLAEPATEDEYMAYLSRRIPPSMSPEDMMMRQLQMELMSNPELMRQVERDPNFAMMLQNPEMLRQMVQQSPVAGKVLEQSRPELREAVNADSLGTQLGGVLDSK